MTYLTILWRNLTVLTATVALTFVLAACSDNNNNDSFTEVSLKPQPANPVVEEVTILGGGPDCCKILGGAIDLRDQQNTLFLAQPFPTYQQKRLAQTVYGQFRRQTPRTIERE